MRTNRGDPGYEEPEEGEEDRYPKEALGDGSAIGAVAHVSSSVS